jgi:DNA uptake protein ComE-like DNA-binding protein
VTSATRSSRWGGADGPTFRWLCLTSVWLVFVLMPNGATTWLGFAIIGFAVLRPTWIVAGLVYFIVTVSISAAADDVGAWSVIFGGALWVAGIAHGIVANRRWQTILWSRMESGVRLIGSGRAQRDKARTQGGRASRTVPPAAAGLLDAAGTDRSDYLADDAEKTPDAPPARASRRRRTPATASRETALPTTPVDVNTATQKEMRTLPGFTRQRATAAIRERDRLGGFSSVEQFATIAGLQPHELVRLGPALECSPKPRRVRSFGRRVDL